MCGIFAYLYDDKTINVNKNTLLIEANKSKHRGPETTAFKLTESAFLVFHRLAIMDVSHESDQPMNHPKNDDIVLICNGEIYNYEYLMNKYNFKLKTKSDCEIILHMYEKYGIERTLKELDGVFAFIICDDSNDKSIIHVARDPFGVRPLFIARMPIISQLNNIAFASEMKSLIKLPGAIINQFKPGCYWSSDSNKFIRYYDNNYKITSKSDIKIDMARYIKNSEIKIIDRLVLAVRKRLMSDREIGCLLSGGLDSSLITALVVRELIKQGKSPKQLKTFSIGLPNSVDLKFAKIVANYLGTDHTEVIVSENDFLNAIPKVIEMIESYDTTTVRASVGNYLIAKYISENTDCKVIFNGDGADEVVGGYRYIGNAPTPEEFHNELVRLLDEIHIYDVLRSDRCIATNGLESRTPFLDINFVEEYMKIIPELKTFNNNVQEKNLLRSACKYIYLYNDKPLLPKEILTRKKEAFSDGVSGDRSWYHIIQEHVNVKISDDEFDNIVQLYKHCTPMLKESLYYRIIFNDLYPNSEHLIPHFWMPKWISGDVIDPSARVLDCY